MIPSVIPGWFRLLLPICKLLCGCYKSLLSLCDICLQFPIIKISVQIFLKRKEKWSPPCSAALASSVAIKIKHDNKQTHFLLVFLVSYYVFVVLLTHLAPLVTKEKSLGLGLTLDDELLVTLIKISQISTNLQIAYLFEMDKSKVTKISSLDWCNVSGALAIGCLARNDCDKYAELF